MVLSDKSLKQLCVQDPPLVSPYDEKLVNPASIDIRVGKTAIVELASGLTEVDLDGMLLELLPGEFALVSTFETISIPNGYVGDMRLKSSIARAGFDHAHAFWVDPGWSGVLTMEVRNNLQHSSLALKYGMRFAQLIVMQLNAAAESPYSGKYQNAVSVERYKP